jgi:N-carbamoylputrescine amidase
MVLGSRPIDRDGDRYNEGFVWHTTTGYRAAHTKAYLPNEAGVWEAAWYRRGALCFTPINIGAVRIGFAICTELWAMEAMRPYRTAGVHLLVTPRLTSAATRNKWLAGGQAAAVITGAWSVSSNRVGSVDGYGGQGWVIDPDGMVVGLTSRDRPWITVDIDLGAAEHAKTTYPRYALP